MKRSFIILLFLCIIAVPVLYAQDEVPSPAATDAVVENPGGEAAGEADDPAPERDVETSRKISAPRTSTATVPRETKSVTNAEPVQQADTTGLLGITDGDFRYERIPGITIKKPASVSEAVPGDQAVSGTGRISALSNDMKNNLIRGGIVLLIFILFIFYRSRSGRRRRRY